MQKSQDTAVPNNQLLASLSEGEYQRLTTFLEPIFLEQKQVLYEPREPITSVYFPIQALISHVFTVEDGGTSDVGLVGNEGVVGLPVILGGSSTIDRAVVQISGSALRMKADILKQEFNRGGELQQRLLLYTQALLTQVAQISICNSFHPIEARLARWLLQSEDRIRTNTLSLTQEFIADMLGTRRASVSEAASSLSGAGIIRYSRGQIEILDRGALEARACECYRIIKNEYTRLFSIQTF